MVERRDPTGGGAGWLARGTRATSCWPRVFLKTRSQDSLARNSRAAVCYTGLRLRREGLRRVRCVEGASRPGGRRMVWMRRVGPGRGRGSLQLQRPCPSVPLGTKAIPGFLPKAPSAKDLVSLPVLLSCGLRWGLRLSRIRLQGRKPGFDSWVGRSPGGGNCNPLQYFGLGNPVDRGSWRVTGSQRVGHSVQFSSVSQSWPTLCDPMNRSTPGLPVRHHLPEFTQTHVHPVRDAIQPSHPRSSPSPPAPNPSQHQSLFQ